MGPRNIVVALVLIAIATGYGFMAAGLPERTMPNTPGPSFFPWLITIVIGGLATALLWQGARAMQGVSFGTGLGGIDRKAALMLVIFAVYLGLLPIAGFLLASIPFTAALILLFDGRNRLVVLAGSIGMPVLLYYLFREIFSILLPAGALGLLGG
jgi:hypothetical protein